MAQLSTSFLRHGGGAGGRLLDSSLGLRISWRTPSARIVRQVGWAIGAAFAGRGDRGGDRVGGVRGVATEALCFFGGGGLGSGGTAGADTSTSSSQSMPFSSDSSLFTC